MVCPHQHAVMDLFQQTKPVMTGIQIVGMGVIICARLNPRSLVVARQVSVSHVMKINPQQPQPL